MQPEEGGRPGRSQGDLPPPKPQGRPPAKLPRADLPPDEPGSGADHDIEHGPYRAEHPARRGQGRGGQRQVPAAQRIARCGRAGKVYHERKSNEANQRQKLRAKGFSPAVMPYVLEDTLLPLYVPPFSLKKEG